MAYPVPDIVALYTGLKAKIVADMALGASGLLPPVFTAYSVSTSLFDTTANSVNDSGALLQIRFGDRRIVPDGLSIFFIPGPVEQNEQFQALTASSTTGIVETYTFYIRVQWKDDELSTTTDTVLSDTPETYRLFIAKVTQTLQVLLGRVSLAGQSGAWSIGGGEALEIACEMLDPCSASDDPESVVQGRFVGLYGELQWSCSVQREGP